MDEDIVDTETIAVTNPKTTREGNTMTEKTLGSHLLAKEVEETELQATAVSEINEQATTRVGHELSTIIR